jgi:uncharacterized protein YqeY
VEDDALVQDVLLKMAKQRRESITMYEDGGRQELADQERAELAVIEEFLPKQMSEEETRAAITDQDEIGAAGPKDMGRVMAELKSRHGASLDMTRASALVKDVLSSKLARMTLSPAMAGSTARAGDAEYGRGAARPWLQKAGREFRACCPFHEEKTPSFYVNDAKGFYHCFGCEAHGDVIRWMTDQRGLPFMDAVKELAAEAGLELPAPDPRAARQAEQRAGLHDVMAAAQVWFMENLKSDDRQRAREYLATRGFSSGTLSAFGFGYAPAGGLP